MGAPRVIRMGPNHAHCALLVGQRMITAADDADLNAQGGLSAHKLIHKEGYRKIML